MVEENVGNENIKSLQHRVVRKSSLKKFIWIELSDVGFETEILTTLTSLPSCDEDFLHELKVKLKYIKHDVNKNYVC